MLYYVRFKNGHAVHWTGKVLPKKRVCALVYYLSTIYLDIYCLKVIYTPYSKALPHVHTSPPLLTHLSYSAVILTLLPLSYHLLSLSPLPHALTLQEDIATVADNVYMAIGSIDQMLTSSCPNLLALKGLRCELVKICREASRYRSTVPPPPIIRW